MTQQAVEKTKEKIRQIFIPIRSHLIVDDEMDRMNYGEDSHNEEMVDLATTKLLSLIDEEKGYIEKAYGGCHKCYGKGYSTYTMEQNNQGPRQLINYCDCSRGEQVKVLVTSSKDKV